MGARRHIGGLGGTDLDALEGAGLTVSRGRSLTVASFAVFVPVIEDPVPVVTMDSRRELLGELPRAAYETVKELMIAAACEDDSFRPGMVSVVQIFGEAARFHRMCTPFVLEEVGILLASGQRCPTSTPERRRSYFVIACFAYSRTRDS